MVVGRLISASDEIQHGSRGEKPEEETGEKV